MPHPQSGTATVSQNVQQRLKQIVSGAIEKHRTHTAKLLEVPGKVDLTDYDSAEQLCVERAEQVFPKTRQQFSSDEAVFDAWARTDPKSPSKITHPVEDLVLCELVLQRNESAVVEFQRRYEQLATTKFQRLRSAGYQMGRLSFAAGDTILEVLCQAALNDVKHEYRKPEQTGSLANQPGRGQHYGELDGQLPVVGFPLRSYGGQTPLFNWLSTVLSRWFYDLLGAGLQESSVSLGTGEIAEGQDQLYLSSGVFSESRHLWAKVRVMGAGVPGTRNGQPKVTSLKTRLLTIESAQQASTEKPAGRTVRDAEIKLIRNQLRQQLSEADDRGQNSGPQDRTKLVQAQALFEKWLSELLLSGGACLSAEEVAFLRRCSCEPQIEIAKSLGKRDYWVSREKTRILEKLKQCFVTAVESQGSEFLTNCVNLLFRKKNVEDFWKLVEHVLTQDRA